jgi:hypothetical protein
VASAGGGTFPKPAGNNRKGGGPGLCRWRDIPRRGTSGLSGLRSRAQETTGLLEGTARRGEGTKNK